MRNIYSFNNIVMTVNLFDGAYLAPDCEITEELCEELVCQSPNGSTEQFGDEVPFNW